ncbi:MAG: zinc dependent phospholipase C family protein [Clostridia bacterium]|nr:zinc dependent phospholipase C family protein [Clostridia bacterium]
MASWMVHLRVAQAITSQHSALCPREFIVGNIAPDSGVPNEDWSVFTPSTDISHFKLRGADGHRAVSVEKYADKYLTSERYAAYDVQQRSFYLGYLCHLMTDVLWRREIFTESVAHDREAYEADPMATVWKWKKDWYDLDFLYLREHPDFTAFGVYERAIDFENVYMDEFSRDAFALRCRYITAFYRDENEHGILDRDYPYLTRERMDAFVESTAKVIGERIAAYGW